MYIAVEEVRTILQRNEKELEDSLSLRVRVLLDELREDLSSLEEEKIELFELLVRLILIADSRPASFIANLLTPLDTENIHLLDDHTLSESAWFLKDYLKKNSILHALKDRETSSTLQNDLEEDGNENNDYEEELISEDNEDK